MFWVFRVRRFRRWSFGLLEDEVFDGAGVFDVSELQLGMGDVAGVADDGAQAHDALEEAGGQGYVRILYM